MKPLPSVFSRVFPDLAVGRSLLSGVLEDSRRLNIYKGVYAFSCASYKLLVLKEIEHEEETNL